MGTDKNRFPSLRVEANVPELIANRNPPSCVESVYSTLLQPKRRVEDNSGIRKNGLDDPVIQPTRPLRRLGHIFVLADQR